MHAGSALRREKNLGFVSRQLGGWWYHLLRWGRMGVEQTRMCGASRALLGPCSGQASIRHFSEVFREAVGSMCLELSIKVRAGAANLGVISV